MDTSSFGFLAMIAFWASAVGGIVIGISWARGRGRKPVDRELLVKSLQSRLKAGEITRKEYQQKLNSLPADRSRSKTRPPIR